MPFTLSHTAAIIPFYKFSKRKLPLFALAIGSMAPDFGYFMKSSWVYVAKTHSLQSSFTFCLPIGFLVLSYFYLMRFEFAFLMPSSQLRSLVIREFEFSKMNFKNILFIILSILIGTWTHILWDSWTHKTGLFVDMFSIENFRLLQHSSTLLGLGVIAWNLKHIPFKWCLSWRSFYWPAVGMLSLLLMIPLITTYTEDLTSFRKRLLLFNVVVGTMRNVGIMVFITLMMLKIFRPKTGEQ